MEQNLPIIAKKAWSLMHVIYYMLKKGISKSKIMADLNMMIKRGKIAGKSLHNLLFHHHHNWAATIFHRHPHHLPFPTPPPPPPPSDEYDFSCTTTPDQYQLSLFYNHKNADKSPMVRQLRITDSPFPLSNGDEDGKVDEDAEKFISRFYNGLRRQS